MPFSDNDSVHFQELLSTQFRHGFRTRTKLVLHIGSKLFWSTLIKRTFGRLSQQFSAMTSVWRSCADKYTGVLLVHHHEKSQVSKFHYPNVVLTRPRMVNLLETTQASRFTIWFGSTMIRIFHFAIILLNDSYSPPSLQRFVIRWSLRFNAYLPKISQLIAYGII